MAWTRAVWFEYTKSGVLEEFEQTLPSNWVKCDKVFWPNRNVESSLKKMSNPTSDWYQFKLKYIKLIDDDKEVCEEYGDSVTAGELDCNEMEIKSFSSPSEKVTVKKNCKFAEKLILMPVPPKMPTTKKRVTSMPDTDTEIPQKIMRNNLSKKILSGNTETSSIPRDTLLSANPPKPFKSNTTSSLYEGYSRLNTISKHQSTMSKSESSFTNTPQSHLNYSRRDSACTRDELLSSKNLEDNGFQSIVLRQLAQITIQMNEISQKLDAYTGTSIKSAKTEIQTQIDDVNVLYEFDKKLGGDQVVFKSFVRQLSCIGGNNRKKTVTNMINRMMTNRLQSKFNLAGSKGKITIKLPMEGLNIYKAIIESVKRCDSKATDSEIRVYIASCLKYAPYRLNGDKRKSFGDELEVLEDDEEYERDDDDLNPSQSHNSGDKDE